jgi:hypothetical protein
MIRVVHPGSEFLPIPDPGSRGQKPPDPGSGSATLVVSGIILIFSTWYSHMLGSEALNDKLPMCVCRRG